MLFCQIYAVYGVAMNYKSITYAIPSGCYLKPTRKKDAYYVYKYTRFYRNENGVPRNESTIIGVTVGLDKFMFHPNDKFFALTGTPIPAEIVNKHKNINNAKSNEKNSYEANKSDTQAKKQVRGSTVVFNKIFCEQGIQKCLRGAFDDESVNLINLASIMIATENSSMMHIKDFYKTSPFVDDRSLASIDDFAMSKLFTHIAQTGADNFFKSWIKHNNDKDDTICYDVTSISTHAQKIQQAEFGYNRDGEGLPQINLGMFSGHKSLLPLMYVNYNGSLNDATQLPYVITKAKETGISVDKLFTMDRGFFDKARIDYLKQAGLDVLVGVSINKYKAIAEYIYALVKHDRHTVYTNLLSSTPGVYAFKEKHTVSNTPGFIHFYYDSLKYYDGLIALQESVKREVELINVAKDAAVALSKSQIAKMSKFHNAKPDDSDPTGYTFSYDEDKFSKAKSLIGWFALFTCNEDIDSEQALKIYRMKDSVEKIFDALKHDLDCKRLKTHRSDTTNGKLFVIFIALILHTYASKALSALKNDEPNRFRKLTYKGLIDELDDITIEKKGDKFTLSKALTFTQKEILKALDVDLSQFELV